MAQCREMVSTLPLWNMFFLGVTCTAARRFSGLLDIAIALDVPNFDT